MSFMVATTIWGVAALGAAALSGVLAHWKNRDYSVWMGWGFLFPPIVIYYALVGSKVGPRPRQPSLDEIDRHH
jgi:hypothetical protein